MVKVGADTSEAESKLNGLSGKLNSFAGGMAKSGTALSAAFTLPLVAGAKSAIDAAAGMERDFNVLQKVITADTKAMAGLEKQAIRLGAETSFSAGEVSGAMLELGKSGMSAEDIMGAIPGVLSLAAAGGVDLASAAELSAATLNTFGMEAEQTTYVADLMANAANASSASITDLMQGVKQGGFAFSNANQGADDLAASLAILTNNGLTGSDAGTALKNAFMRMMSPTKEAQGVMDELGISFYDTYGNMKAMPDIIDMLNVALAPLNQEQRDLALSTLFMSDGMKAFVPLLNEGKEGFEEYLKEINRAGASGEAADAFMQGLAGAIEYFTGAIESAGIALAKPFLDGLGEGIRYVADLVTAFTELPAPVRNAALAFLAVLAAAGPVMLLIGAIAGGIAFLLSPIGLIVVGLGALAAAFAADFGGIRTAVVSAIDFVRPYFQQLMGWISAAAAGDLTPLREGLQGALNSVQAAIENFTWSDFVEFLRWVDHITHLSDWAAYIGGLLWTNFIKPLGDWAAYVGKVIWGEIIDVFGGWATYIDNLTWEGVIDTFEGWATYITSIDWSHFVSGLIWRLYVGWLSWSDWVTGLLWGAYVFTLNWPDWINDLLWSLYVGWLNWDTVIGDLLWDTYVFTLKWENWVKGLNWPDFIKGVVQLHAYVSALSWNAFVKFLNWYVHVGKIVWSNFIKMLTWENVLKTTITWGNFIKPFRWATFIPPFAWPAAIAAFAWRTFVKPLVWGTVVKMLNWGEKVVKLWWSTFVTHANLPEWVTTFSWEDFVSDITWPTGTIDGFDWGTWVDDVYWPLSISGFKWSDFVDDLEWPDLGQMFRDWIDGLPLPGWLTPEGEGPKVEPGALQDNMNPRNFFPGGGGGGFSIPSSYTGPAVEVPLKGTSVEPPSGAVELDFEIGNLEALSSQLSAAMPTNAGQPYKVDSSGIESAVSELSGFKFNWPPYPDWTWEPYPTFKWPALPKWTWPPINRPGWLNDLQVPRPGWISELWAVASEIKAARGGGAAPGVGMLASGTNDWRGGWTIVGEQGPELVNLPRHSTVYPARQTEAMLAGAGGGDVQVNIAATVTQDIDVVQLTRQIARQVAAEIKRGGR